MSLFLILVITIIVMLILAGVSLNAIVGDNGILTQAQNATIKSGMAVLEEYLQEEYVENYDKFNNDESKIVQLQNMYPEYFYIPANEGIGGLRYIVSSDGHLLYLIKKSGLPEEIKNQLVGGEAGEKTYSDYQTLNDVYGVTKDLTVYYSSGQKDDTGKSILIGANFDEMETENPGKIVFKDNTTGIASALAEFDLNGDGALQYFEIAGVKNLTINKDMSNLSDLYNLSNLSKLIIENANISSLRGVENCSNLSYIFIKNSKIDDYTSMGKLGSKLNYLYFLDATNEEITKLGNGIQNYDLPNLNYLGCFHRYDANIEYSWNTTTYRRVQSSTSELTDISGFSKFTQATKKAVKYLYINDNQIESIECLSGFDNLYYLRAQNNKITSLVGLENKPKLTYACLNKNDLTDTDEDLGINSLSALNGNTKIYWLDIANNINIKYINYLKDCSSLKYLYLDNLLSIKDMENKDVGKLIGSLNETVYDSKYALSLIDTSITTRLNLSNATITEEQFRNKITNCTKLNFLNLSNVILKNSSGEVITGDDLNQLLNDELIKLKNLTELSLYNIKFSDLSFVTSLSKLRMLDLRNTDVTTEDATGLTKIENVSSIGLLAINNVKINLSKIPNTLKRLYDNPASTDSDGTTKHIMAPFSSRINL